MKTKATYSSILFVVLFLSVFSSIGAKAQSAPAVAGWYFRAVGGYPAAISFEPVVLFKNGEFYEVGDEPLEALNVAESKSKRSKAWGNGAKAGKRFT